MPEAQAVAQLSKLKKIELYASHLINEAGAKEKQGRIGDATADYLQAADLLLLIAKNQENYTAWKAFTDKAMACQQHVRVIIATKKQRDSADPKA